MSSDSAGTDERIRDRLCVVRKRVAEALRKSERGLTETKILIASKYYTPEQIAVLADAGVELLGENRAENLLEKQRIFGDAFEWHFIGHLQRRKVRQIIGNVTLVHSVDSLRLIEELAKRAPEDGIEMLVQV